MDLDRRALQRSGQSGKSRVAVLLSFNNGTVTCWDGEPSITDLSRGEYGSRVALKRVVDLLEEYEVPASFFIPALSLKTSPQMAEEIKRLPRHELVVNVQVELPVE